MSASVFKIFKEKTKEFRPIGRGETFRTRSVFSQQAFGELTPSDSEFIRYYQQVEALADAVDRIGDKVAELDLILKNETSKTFINNFWVLDLLKNPNTNSTYSEFMKETSNYLNITGNNYWILARSPVMNKVLEILPVSPELITISTGSDGRPQTYNYAPQGTTMEFIRVDVGKNIRYLTSNKRNELIHIRDFNPNGYSSYIQGVSRCHAITYAILQYKAASIHNLSLLSNGARPSGLFILNPDMMKLLPSQEQREELTSSLENMFTGEANAGRPIAVAAVENYINLMASNADMDFFNLKKGNAEAIYNRFKIPLMLIGTDAATLDNYQVALRAFYDDAIIPHFRQIMSCLKIALSYYDESVMDLDFIFNPMAVPTLRERRIQELNDMKTLGVMTDNQILAELDMIPYPNGDEIWKNTNTAPTPTDGDTPSSPQGEGSGTLNDDDQESETPTDDEDDDGNNTSNEDS